MNRINPSLRVITGVNIIVVACQVMDELSQYDTTGGRGCGGISPRRRRRSFCGRWYWPIFPGGSSSKEVFEVGSFELSSLSPSATGGIGIVIINKKKKIYNVHIVNH